ncbi:unnamed protein product [Auanema sp. JU1783]|nr:unnamed protein product [Auanema sp. JU1783]
MDNIFSFSLFICLCSLPHHISSRSQTIFQCDRVFDETQPKGEFSFPILPKSPTDDLYKDNNTRLSNLQCVYSFVAGQGQRVKLEFEHFQLAGSSESCEIEYVDIYSELESIDSDLLAGSLGGRYCGSVAPHIRISLRRVIVLVFHSRARERSHEFGFRGKYSFIAEAKYVPGRRVDSKNMCTFLIEPSNKKKGVIFSPTYPGTYPKNFHCSYLLRGRSGQRIRLLFRDFDVFFGGEHCPYDSVTLYDGSRPTDPIIKKVCGLQQRMELYSVGPDLLIHFNSTNPAKADPRGFVIEYEFSTRFVDIVQLVNGERGVTHMRGTECDIRVESNRETIHYIHSPAFPNLYPANTTCAYILDGLQGDQNLEKVIVTFEELAVLSTDADAVNSIPSGDDITCPVAWVGIATSESSMKTVLSTTDDQNFETTLCERIPPRSTLLGPYESEGPRMVIQFGTTDKIINDDMNPYGFKAKIEFKTDFGVAGEPMGTSNECLFRFRSPMGFFNSPRYPANYPLDTNCSYYIQGVPGQQILIYFEQFALFEEDESCKDWLEIFDVFHEPDGSERLALQERYCAGAFPGPTVSAFGAHEMRVIFSSDSSGTGNGFKALYEIRPSRREDIPSTDTHGGNRCGRKIYASATSPTGSLTSPNYPIKYTKDVHCDWEIIAREGYKLLLTISEMEVEGAMTATTANCQKAAIRVAGASRTEYCGTDQASFAPVVTQNNTVRISFLTSPDKVNGLKGFNMTWTEVRQVNEMSECSSSSEYLCTYSRLCISADLRCNGDDNCGAHDDTDESHCELEISSADKTIVIAGVFCGSIFLFICGFFCYLFKKKLERKKKKQRHTSSRHRQRQPYRSQKPMGKAGHMNDSELPSPATSRFVHHDATGILPPITLQTINDPNADYTFYG